MGHAYSATPDEDAGWSGDEVYKDTQKQRALEAEIRKNKRIAANESTSELERAEAKAKIWNAQQQLRGLVESKPWLRRDASREQAPELDTQPRGAKNKPKTTKHAAERMAERGVTKEQINEALAHPLKTFDVEVDDEGRKSQKIIGETTTVAINPDTGAIITTYPTNRKMRRRYGSNQETRVDT